MPSAMRAPAATHSWRNEFIFRDMIGSLDAIGSGSVRINYRRFEVLANHDRPDPGPGTAHYWVGCAASTPNRAR